MSKLKIFLIIVLFFIVLGAVSVWFVAKQGKLIQLVANEAAKQLVGDSEIENILGRLLGLNEEKNYLLLFLNNTEIRPGGGFIGVYAVVAINKGAPGLVKLEGTELLDRNAPDILPNPPQPLAKYLKVKKWYFRDSNWSPDFVNSTLRALELYKAEGGQSADQINGVIGFTPTVFEELFKIIGPITVNGVEYNSGNFVEKLEYEVEYGYAEKGVSADERKAVIKDLTGALAAKLKNTVLINWSKYQELVLRMLKEKQIIFYSIDPAIQAWLDKQGWAGQLKKPTADYLLWADANLGALKTDAAINRTLIYQISTSTNGFVSKITMRYQHRGSFDWRTSRYRDYVRVFVPKGSALLKTSGAMDMEKSSVPGVVDQGEENGLQWFGAFIVVEPGKTGELSFTYKVAPVVESAIISGDFKLLAQKQIGTVNVPLTLGLEFGKKVTFAAPSEPAEKQGNTRYDLVTDLREDRLFEIRF